MFQSRGAFTSWPNPFKLWLHDLIAYRVPNERRGRREVELTHDATAMRFNGLEADVQEIGDLLVGVTLGDELNDPTFTVRQARSLPCGTRKEGIEERLRDFGGEERLVSRKGLNSTDEMTVCVGLDEVTACACLQQFLDESFVVMHRKDEHFRARLYRADLPGRLHAVDERQ